MKYKNGNVKKKLMLNHLQRNRSQLKNNYYNWFSGKPEKMAKNKRLVFLM